MQEPPVPPPPTSNLVRFGHFVETGSGSTAFDAETDAMEAMFLKGVDLVQSKPPGSFIAWYEVKESVAHGGPPEPYKHTYVFYVWIEVAQ